MQIADCFDLDDARRSYFGQLFPLSECGRALRVRQVCGARCFSRSCTGTTHAPPARRRHMRCVCSPGSLRLHLLPADPSGIVPAGPTAADLGLHLPPGRGPVDFQEVFHFKPAGGS